MTIAPAAAQEATLSPAGPAAEQERSLPPAAPDADQKPAPTPATADATVEAPATARPHVPDLSDCHQGPLECFWLYGDYLLWWIKKGPLTQPLLTAGSVGSNGNVVTGDVLLGNSSLDYGRFSGFEFGGGAWLDECHHWGLEGEGFFLERKTVHASFASDANGNPVLARPFNDALSGLAPTAAIVSAPGAFSGSFAMSSSSRLWGTELNALRNLYASPRFRADWLLGFRYLDLQENLNLLQQTQALANGQLFFLNNPANPNPAPVDALSIADGFSTRNQVYLGQLGMRFEGHAGSAFFRVTAKAGFGPNHQSVSIAGTTTATLADGTTQTASGGLLALPGANIGRATNSPFVIVPQVDLRLGYQVTSRLQLFFGYDFLFINEVARPGSQIDLNVNTALVPSHPNFGAAAGPSVPSRLTKMDEFWAQGINFGIEFRY